MQMNALYPWLEQTYQQLTEAFMHGRGHHALLFKTERCLGTENLIRAFAAWLFCLEKANGQRCGHCKSCLLWAAANHPDFHLIEPIENRDISIDQIRELTTTLQQFAQQGGNAVIYIRAAERLTTAAANALLKTLEEPPQNVYFLLEAPLQAPLLATIQSRCQTWLINPPDPESANAWLQAQLPEQSSDNLRIALRLNHQRPLECKTFLENDRLSQRKTFFQNFWRFFKSRDVWLIYSAFAKEKEDALQQLEWLESFFADSLKAKLGITSGWINPDFSKGIEPFAATLSAFALLKGVKIIQHIARDLREINGVNQDLILLDGLVTLITDVFEEQNAI